MLTEAEARRRLRQFVREAGSQAKAAARLGVGRSYVNHLLASRRRCSRLSPSVLAKLGLARDVRIVEAK